MTIFLILTQYQQEKKLREKKKLYKKQEPKQEVKRPKLSDSFCDEDEDQVRLFFLLLIPLQKQEKLREKQESPSLLEEDCTLERALLKVRPGVLFEDIHCTCTCRQS